ncbi:MAG: 50S ribosome-binding GTPase, partial [Gammaproteobacteria bacterium]|nr:50S ribosome-binding GTPase [Gammaproteobacteria bacterium]
MAFLPVIALVGRPNVGKSTLFNRLTRSRDAIVDNQPGITRDRLYGRGKVGERPFLVVDTGGLEAEDGPFRAQIRQQVEQVVEEAQVVIL